MSFNRILVTGAAGKVARSVRAELGGMCRELRLTDITPFDATAANQTVQVADLADAASVSALVEGVDAVVHFAGYPREAAWPVLLDANIRSVINLWESAAAAGVDRILYASSNHAVGYYPRTARIDARVPARPDSRYGATKVFMEAVAQLHADKSGLRAFGMRIGASGLLQLQPFGDVRKLSLELHAELAQVFEFVFVVVPQILHRELASCYLVRATGEFQISGEGDVDGFGVHGEFGFHLKGEFHLFRGGAFH